MAENWLDEDISLETEAPAAPAPAEPSPPPAAPSPPPNTPKTNTTEPEPEGPAFDNGPLELSPWLIAAVAGVMLLAALLGGRRDGRR